MPQRLEHTEVEESHTPCRVIDFSLLSCLPQKGKKCIRTPKISKPIPQPHNTLCRSHYTCSY